MILFRQATESDLSTLCVLGAEVNGFHHEARPDIFAASVPVTRQVDFWRGSLGREGTTTIVAQADSVLVGLANASIVVETSPLFLALRYARVGTVGVTATHRGLGIGRQLMQHVEAWARQQGATEVHLNVWAFNDRARRLYDELGL